MGTSTQVGLRGLAGRRTRQPPPASSVPLVYFSSPRLIPDGSLAHRNNTNPSTVVKQPALERGGVEAGSSIIGVIFRDEEPTPM